MRKVFKNMLAFSPKYVKLLIGMSLFVVIITASIVTLTFKDIEKKRTLLPHDKFALYKTQAKRRAYFQIGVGIITILGMVLISTFKRKEEIVLTTEGVMYKSFLKKIFIPWGEIKDVKILMAGTSMERCKIKGKDKEIIFNPFFLDASQKYTYKDDGIYDKHGNVMGTSIKKGRLYKDINMYRKK